MSSSSLPLRKAEEMTILRKMRRGRKSERAFCRSKEPIECSTLSRGYNRETGFHRPVFSSTFRLRSLSHHRNPYLILCVLRICVPIHLNIRRVAIFISGTGKPLGNNASFQVLNGLIAARTGKDCPCRCRYDIFLKIPALFCAGNCNPIFPLIFIVAGAHS